LTLFILAASDAKMSREVRSEERRSRKQNSFSPHLPTPILFVRPDISASDVRFKTVGFQAVVFN